MIVPLQRQAPVVGDHGHLLHRAALHKAHRGGKPACIARCKRIPKACRRVERKQLRELNDADAQLRGCCKDFLDDGRQWLHLCTARAPEPVQIGITSVRARARDRLVRRRQGQLARQRSAAPNPQTRHGQLTAPRTETIDRMLVQPELNLCAQAPQRRLPWQHPRQAAAHRARRLRRMISASRRSAQKKPAARERLKCKTRSLKELLEIFSKRREGCHRKLEKPAIIQVHTGEAGDAVHGSGKPQRAARRVAAGGDAGGCFRGECLGANPTREPSAPAFVERADSAETRDALEPRQSENASRAFLGKIEVGDDDDELVHERVF